MEQSHSEKLTVTQLVKKLHVFYGNCRLFTVLSRAHLILRPCVTYHNRLIFFYGKEKLAPHSTSKLKDHPWINPLSTFLFIFLELYHILFNY